MWRTHLELDLTEWVKPAKEQLNTHLSYHHHNQDISQLLQHPALGQGKRLQAPAI